MFLCSFLHWCYPSTFKFQKKKSAFKNSNLLNPSNLVFAFSFLISLYVLSHLLTPLGMFSWHRGAWTGVQRTQVLTLGPGQFCTSPKDGCLHPLLPWLKPQSHFLPVHFLSPSHLFCLPFSFPFLPNPIILQFLSPYISSSPGRRYHVKFNLYTQHNVYFIITKLSICICIIKV